MNDIHDIKTNLLWFPIDITYSIIFIIFIVILFLLYKYLNREKEFNILEEKEIIIEKDFINILVEFEKNFIDINSDIFYSKLLDILRDIYYKNEHKNIESMTFDEINKLNLDKDLNELIKSIYYKEYAKDIDDNNDLRKEYITKVKQIIL